MMGIDFHTHAFPEKIAASAIADSDCKLIAFGGIHQNGKNAWRRESAKFLK